jgi:hypothetical protein
VAVQGTPKFDAIQLMEISAIRFTAGGEPQFRARGAFVNTITGSTYGQTSCVHFSQNTRLALKALQEAIEQDIANLVFKESTKREDVGVAEVGGIGETLGRQPLSEDGVESV